MSKICQIAGIRPMSGNRRSHSMSSTKRRFLPNLHSHRFWIESKKKFITVRVSSKGIRLINKKGIEKFFYNSYTNKNISKEKKK